MACLAVGGFAAVALQPAASSSPSSSAFSCRVTLSSQCGTSRLFFPLPKQSGRSSDLSSVVVCSSSNGAASWSDGSSDAWVEGVDSVSEGRKRSISKKLKKSVAGIDQSDLMDPWQLADPDSKFADFYGVQLHYKVSHPSDPEETPSVSFGPRRVTTDLAEVSIAVEDGAVDRNNSLPAILLHGFGASLFSYERIMRPLAKLLHNRVLAFDRPAFGLTSRASHPFSRVAAGAREKAAAKGDNALLNPYSLGFSSAAALSFIDLLQSQQAILIGHSAGCIVAANAYLEAPERVAAIVMLAPALIAPLVVNQFVRAVESRDDSVQQESTPKKQNSFLRGLSTVWSALVGVALAFVGFFKSVLGSLLLFSKKALSWLLRTSLAVWLLRFVMDKGGRWIVRYAWFDPLKADDYVIDGYTKPLGCRDWDKALLEFVISLAAGSDGERPLSQRFNEITCPVLVVTGDSDRIVPPWNAERLAKVFPKAQFREIKNCGHLPHEEKIEETLAIIREFLGTLSGSIGEAVPA